ncbi:MAG: inositol monophosphatase family protein [Leptolyngbyaceae cyanobacterium bins.302]|nr:inositol monophosphatase family protein [Leptolyngbyaceae cyanobacterium bins.302]
MSPIPPDLDLAIRQTVRRCGLQAEQMATRGFEVMEKGHQDYVTTIDTALDAELFSAFSTLFAEDGVITEENSRSRQQFHAQYSRLWCIDPIDGTEDFIYGKRNYSVMVGLLEHYQPRAGWIYAPTRDQMYFGGTDWGLFQSAGDRAPVPIPTAPLSSDLSSLRLMIGHRDQKRYGEAIVAQLPEIKFQFMGSFGLKVLEVILGHADAYLYLNRRVKVWDTAGPLALARAAGLTCCSLEGEPIRFIPQALEPVSLSHKQAILIGHPGLIQELRPRLLAAIHTKTKSND